MTKRISLHILSLSLLLILASACSTSEDNATAQNKNTTDSTDTKEANRKAEAQRDSLALHNAVVECLKRKNISGQVRGIGVIDYVGDFLACRIVAVETANGSLVYLVVFSLEDENGNEYPHAEFLNGVHKEVVDLLKNKTRSSSEAEKE